MLNIQDSQGFLRFLPNFGWHAAKAWGVKGLEIKSFLNPFGCVIASLLINSRVWLWGREVKMAAALTLKSGGSTCRFSFVITMLTRRFAP